MEINVQTLPVQPPADRAHIITIVINSFKGRREVMVNLFRAQWASDEEEAYPWEKLIGSAHPNSPLSDADNPASARKMLLESFTAEERDAVMDYLKTRYADKILSIDSAVLDFPIPKGLPALSEVPEGKDIGIIRFERISGYSLPFVVHGLYDLSLHTPIGGEEEE